MDKSEINLGTIDKWQIYADKKGELHVIGIWNNLIVTTDAIVEFDVKNKIIRDRTNSYRLGTSFNSYQIAYYRLARGRKIFDEPNHK